MRYGIPCIFLIIALMPLAMSAQESSNEDKPGLWPYMEKPAKTDETSRLLIDLNLKARGGRVSFEKIKSARFKGTLIEGKTDYEYTVLTEKDGPVRTERYRYHIGRDYLWVTATNGSEAWTRQLQPEKDLPSGVGEITAQLLQLEGQLPYLMLNAESHGHVFSYRGELNFAGRRAYLLHAWLSFGIEIEVYMDVESFHLINYRIPYQLAGQTFVVDHTPTRLENKGGIWWEIGYRTHIGEKTFRRIEFKSLEVNVPTSEEDFSKPAVKEFWLRGGSKGNPSGSRSGSDSGSQSD